MTEQEIKEFWKDGLYAIPEEVVKRYHLPEETENYLINFGIIMDEDYRESCLRDMYLKDFKYKQFGKEEFWRVTEHCLDEEGIYISQSTGIVYIITDFKRFGKAYCNKDIKTYIEFQTIAHKILLEYVNTDIDDDEEAAYYYAREVIESLKKIESKSFYNNSYWANKLSGYGDGYIFDQAEWLRKLVKKGEYPTYDDAYYDVLLNGIEKVKPKLWKA